MLTHRASAEMAVLTPTPRSSYSVTFEFESYLRWPRDATYSPGFSAGCSCVSTPSPLTGSGDRSHLFSSHFLFHMLPFSMGGLQCNNPKLKVIELPLVMGQRRVESLPSNLVYQTGYSPLTLQEREMSFILVSL